MDEKQGYGEMIGSEGDSVSFEEETDAVKSPHMHSSPGSSAGAEKVSKVKASMGWQVMPYCKLGHFHC